MAKYNYYGIKGEYTWHLATDGNSLQMKWYQPKLFGKSDVVYCQGPRGGVRVCHINWANDFYRELNGQKRYNYGYRKKNSKEMKEFVWVKLKAKTLNPKLWK